LWITSIRIGMFHNTRVRRRVNALDFHSDGRVCEPSVHIVDGDRIVRVCRIAAHIHDDLEATAWTGVVDEVVGNEVRDRCGEVDAVDEDVNIKDLLERTTLRSLCHVPLHNVITKIDVE
jgi:hypothetical protein